MKRDFKGSVPSDELLEKVAPMSIWNHAIKQAKRSIHRRHRTGAVIYDPFDNWSVIARGCSHDPYRNTFETRTVHAERHALMYLRPNISLFGLGCCIVTLTKANYFAQSSKPCASCAKALQDVGINHCTFAERANDGSWRVMQTRLEDLQDLQLPYLW